MTKYRYNVLNGMCILEIRPTKENKYILFGDGKEIQSYSSPEEAAEAVHLRETGYWVWDQLKEGPENPLGLDEWEKIND